MSVCQFRSAVAAQLVDGPAWARSFQDMKPIITAMVADGELARVAPSGARFRNMIALTRAGAARYHSDRPEVFVALSDAEQCDAIAEDVANGSSLAAAARRLGVTYFVAQRLWAQICAGLGRQAA